MTIDEIKEALAQDKARLDDIDARLSALEGNPAPEYDPVSTPEEVPENAD